MRTSQSPMRLLNVIVWLVGCCLLTLPQTTVAPLRALVWDLAVPGQLIVVNTTDWGRTQFQTRVVSQWKLPPTADLRVNQELERRVRQLESENALLRKQQQSIPTGMDQLPRSNSEDPLFLPELLSARLIGTQTAKLWHEQPVLSLGQTRGARSDLLVFDRDRPNLDLGTRAGVQQDQPVYAGRIVVGRVAQVGFWTSSLRLVTDVKYHGKARIFHRHQPRRGERTRVNSEAWIAGGVGILQGNGKGGCLVRDLDAAHSVAVGDQVFTAEEDGVLHSPLYYGDVVRAEIHPGDLHWNVEVRPAVQLEDLREVQILKTKLNPVRRDSQPVEGEPLQTADVKG